MRNKLIVIILVFIGQAYSDTRKVAPRTMFSVKYRIANEEVTIFYTPFMSGDTLNEIEVLLGSGKKIKVPPSEISSISVNDIIKFNVVSGKTKNSEMKLFVVPSVSKEHSSGGGIMQISWFFKGNEYTHRIIKTLKNDKVFYFKKTLNKKEEMVKN